ncbi:MAG: DNA mismatch repair protein MutS [Methylocystis sp.]|nr:DNA mismatch repair protein MutS [Methylocystis sp.]MCA3584348.1 DNA mismatch repair protein MutS [Methylocystis sp.]MCA3589363.1 DNA mismatch repair protein MutS [Methylocystis sp.]MCA3592631.1 DNA mismatch repair protein MutS [Methylocystis sp.]
MLDPLRPEAADSDGKVTPSMAQYIEIKAANPDSLLFYRMGDFYELFFEDAVIASRTLGIVLTKRGKHHGGDIPMCGVPVIRADEYLQRLIAAGHRVAVCEQLEDPAEARKRGSKAVVRRDVVRLVTAGTITEEALLDPARASILLGIGRMRADDQAHVYGLAEVDISTGRFVLSECADDALATEIARIDPREIVLPDAIRDDPALGSLWRELRAAVARVPRDGIDSASAARRVAEYFGVSGLDGFGQFSKPELIAAATVLSYVERTQLGVRPALTPPVAAGSGQTLQIDAATRANLELTRTLGGERAGSLLHCIDMSVTPAGGRLLAERLAGPLTAVAAIRDRLDSVSAFADDALLRERVRTALKGAPDMPRALSRLAMERGGPRDLAAIRDGLSVAAALAALLPEALPSELARASEALGALDPAIAAMLSATLADDLPLQKRDGGFVRAGHVPELEEMRALRDDSRRVIAGLQMRYGEESEARTLRIKHNNFLGYFVEVPQKDGERFVQPPLNALFIHRQTMQGAMRFSTAELGSLEAKIASAGDRAIAIELGVFDELRALVLAHQAAIQKAAEALAVLDVSAALAELANRRGWVRPQIDDGKAFAIRAGRHPVVEEAVRREGQSFIANDSDLSPPDREQSGRILLVTGPNMAGKSTFLRQNAVIAVLAQMGAFVPADAAHIGVVDRLFSRVGAADDLARGRSTFMVEMVETAAILNQATLRSLVILDEIGRGTATFDGLSIAWAAIEHLHAANRSRALFATHYHELTALAQKLPRLANVTMRVTDHDGDVVFLHEVTAGAADRSYGIQVAKLAGLPAAVVERAKSILAELEKGERQAPVDRLLGELPLFAALPVARPEPPAAKAAKKDALREALAEVHPDEMTPREALEALYRLKGLG